MPVHYPVDASTLPLDSCTPPLCAASSRRPGAILHGSNGSLWIAQPHKDAAAGEASTSTCRSDDVQPAAAAKEGSSAAEQWALYLVAGQQESIYWVHDNGGRPFLVRVTPQIFAAYQNPAEGYLGARASKQLEEEQKKRSQKMLEEDRSDEYVVDPSFSLHDRFPLHQVEMADQSFHPRLYAELVAGGDSYLRLWAGEDESVSHRFGLGNSVLVQLAERQHMFIGNQVSIFQVAAGDSIERYESPIGNSDVPYPYAVGTKNTYLLIEDSYIPNALRCLEEEDPYQQLYDSYATNTKWQYMTEIITCSRQWSVRRG